MAGHPKATAMKRSKERARIEKRTGKVLRREARKKAKEAELPPEDGSDPDLAGIKPGPQPPPF
jgi:hypothetical protein